MAAALFARWVWLYIRERSSTHVVRDMGGRGGVGLGGVGWPVLLVFSVFKIIDRCTTAHGCSLMLYGTGSTWLVVSDIITLLSPAGRVWVYVLTEHNYLSCRFPSGVHQV